jgi:hypothetical protein
MVTVYLKYINNDSFNKRDITLIDCSNKNAIYEIINKLFEHKTNIVMQIN